MKEREKDKQREIFLEEKVGEREHTRKRKKDSGQKDEQNED